MRVGMRVGAADVSSHVGLQRGIHCASLHLGYISGLNLAIGALLAGLLRTDLAADGRIGRRIPERVGGTRARLPDAVVAAWAGLVGIVGVCFEEELVDGRVGGAATAVVTLGILAGVVAAFGRAGCQGIQIDETADLQWRCAGDGAFQRKGVAIDKGDVTVRVAALEVAFELGVLGGRGVAGLVAFGFADEHGTASDHAEALASCCRALAGFGAPGSGVGEMEVAA